MGYDLGHLHIHLDFVKECYPIVDSNLLFEFIGLQPSLVFFLSRYVPLLSANIRSRKDGVERRENEQARTKYIIGNKVVCFFN